MLPSLVVKMRENKEGSKTSRSSKPPSIESNPIILGIDDFKGGFSYKQDAGRQGMTVSSVVGNTIASRGLEVAVANLQEYCNELENKLLAKFDAASQKRDLSSMAECAKILSQFNRGTGVMQHYVGLRTMFDLEVMNADAQVVLGDPGTQPIPSNVGHGLSSLYNEITDTVRKEAATITAVFPFPNDVMSILVQYLRLLEVAYEKTLDLSRDLRCVGCGDLDIEVTVATGESPPPLLCCRHWSSRTQGIFGSDVHANCSTNSLSDNLE